MKSKYYINYCTGAGNKWVDGDLMNVMEIAEQDLCYTQQPVKIEDEDGEVVAQLPWYGVAPEENDIVICHFGDFGFYGEWIEY